MHEHLNRNERDDGAWRTRAKWAFGGFFLVAAFFLLAEHRAHVLPYLPWLILLACPLMHVFMHGKHGSHGGHRHGSEGENNGSTVASDRSVARNDHSQHGGAS